MSGAARYRAGEIHGQDNQTGQKEGFYAWQTQIKILAA